MMSCRGSHLNLVVPYHKVSSSLHNKAQLVYDVTCQRRLLKSTVRKSFISCPRFLLANFWNQTNFDLVNLFIFFSPRNKWGTGGEREREHGREGERWMLQGRNILFEFLIKVGKVPCSAEEHNFQFCFSRLSLLESNIIKRQRASRAFWWLQRIHQETSVNSNLTPDQCWRTSGTRATAGCSSHWNRWKVCHHCCAGLKNKARQTDPPGRLPTFVKILGAMESPLMKTQSSIALSHQRACLWIIFGNSGTNKDRLQTQVSVLLNLNLLPQCTEGIFKISGLYISRDQSLMSASHYEGHTDCKDKISPSHIHTHS